jgi:hypothetical protein
MLPSADRLLEGLPIFVRRRGLVVRFSRPQLVAALEEAERLAAGNEHDEPASLFYACARRPSAFGTAGQLIVPFLVQCQARAVGLELAMEPDDVTLILMRLRVVRGEIGFDELRGWFASRMHPAM